MKKPAKIFLCVAIGVVLGVFVELEFKVFDPYVKSVIDAWGAGQ